VECSGNAPTTPPALRTGVTATRYGREARRRGNQRWRASGSPRPLSSLSLPAANAVCASVARVVAVPTSDRNSRRVVWGVRVCETCMDSAGRFISAPFSQKRKVDSPLWPRCRGGGRERTSTPAGPWTNEGVGKLSRHRKWSRRTPMVMGMRMSDRGKDLSRLKHRLSSHASAPKSPARGYGYESSMSQTCSRAG